MVEITEARSGEPTISFNQKFLASCIDPRKEGWQWALKYQTAFSGLRSAIVIGAGAGYHLVELKKLCPHLNVICLEANSEIIKFHSQNFELARFGIKILPLNLDGICEFEEIQDAVSGAYRVLIHGSALLVAEKDAKLAKDHLNGRTVAGLCQIAESRGWKVMKPEEESLLSIKDLEFEPSAQERSIRPQDLLAVLKELLA